MRHINTLTFIVIAFGFRASSAAYMQQGGPLVTPGSVSVGGVAVSADGNTALIGIPSDNGAVGAALVFTRSGSVWTQQGGKLVGSLAFGAANQGRAVALSADGNTAAITGDTDNSGRGATWIFTRDNGVWSQQGSKLLAAGSEHQGDSVCLSADGNTALIGGARTWVFTRNGGVWAQQGDSIGTGSTIALSADGNTAIFAAFSRHQGVEPGLYTSSVTGTVSVRSSGVWTPQSVGSFTELPFSYYTSAFVALSGDGNTALLGGSGNDPWGDLPLHGQLWEYTRNGATWTQGSQLRIQSPLFLSGGPPLSLSADGNMALVGGVVPTIFTRSNGAWTPTASLNGNPPVGYAKNVSLSADGTTAVVGAQNGAWVFSANHKQFALTTPGFVPNGTSFQIAVSAFDTATATNPNYAGTVHFTSTDSKAVLPADYTYVGADSGQHMFNVTLNTIGPATITVTDTADSSITGTSSSINVYLNPIAVVPSTLPHATLDLASYNQVVSAFGGNGALTLSLSGALPPGLSFDPATGVISGTATTLGAFAFTIKATDVDGHTGSTTYLLTVDKPVATVTLGNLSYVYDGTSKSASAATIPPNLSVFLTYDGGSTLPTNVGSYTVVGTVIDPYYAGSATAVLQITPRGTVTIVNGPAATPNPAIVSQPIAFSVQATHSNGDPLSYVWTFGDGSQGSGASVSHAYALAGTYTATATVTGGASPVVASVEVTVNNPAGITTIVTGPAATPNPVTVAQSVAFSATATSSNGDPLTYAWNFGDGAQGSGASVSHAYAAIGTYTATVTVSGGVAPVSASIQVTVISTAGITTVNAPSAAPNPAAVFQPVAFSVSATNSNGSPLTYAWDFGDGALGSGTSVSHTYAWPGKFTAKVTVAGGAAPVSASMQVAVEKASAAVTLGNLTHIYDGAPKSASAATIPANLSVGFTYDGVLSAPVNVGSYTVVATIKDDIFQGSATAVLTIVNASVTTIVSEPSATPNPATALKPVTFSAAAANSSGYSLIYAWAFGDGAQMFGATVTHAYASAGTYTATVTVTSYAAAVSSSVQVVVNPSVALVGAGPDSDGDGFSDAFENAVFTLPGDPASTPTGTAAPASLDGLTIAKASIKVNFARSGSDSISFSGTLVVPPGFNPDGAKAILDVGGVTKAIVLTAKGSGVYNYDSIKIGLKSKGSFAAQTAKYSVNFKKGSFALLLSAAGLTNTAAKGTTVLVPFTIVFNNNVLQTLRPMSYTAKPGKSGAAK